MIAGVRPASQGNTCFAGIFLKAFPCRICPTLCWKTRGLMFCCLLLLMGSWVQLYPQQDPNRAGRQSAGSMSCGVGAGRLPQPQSTHKQPSTLTMCAAMACGLLPTRSIGGASSTTLACVAVARRSPAKGRRVKTSLGVVAEAVFCRAEGRAEHSRLRQGPPSFCVCTVSSQMA
jgi:hypothetical protein